ncbi:MAG: hypothetical protein GX430_00420 [Treponema sp.]|nr:hypothetical protein [Treponema sp.]
MKRTRILAAAAVVLAALTLASCQDFFTSSLAGWAQRDPTVPSGLTADQAMTIANQAIVNCDTGLARALLPQMADFLVGTPSDALVEAAVDTAVLATGIGEAFGEVLAAVGTSIIETGTIDPADYDTVAAILGSVGVSADGFDVFTFLATNYDDAVPADVTALAALGVTAEDLALAAAALLVQQATVDGATLDTLIDGTASLTTTDPDYQLALSMLDLATALDPTNDLVSLANGWL